MPRSVSQTLLDAIQNQQGETIIRVLSWSDKTAYDASPNTPDTTWECLKYDIFSTSGKATIKSNNVYSESNFSVFVIERGVSLSGIEYTVKSGLYFVTLFHEKPGKINIEGSSFPNTKITISADQTYEEVIEAFCLAIGKTASYKYDAADWLSYAFLPAGQQVISNKSNHFENLLRQKYTTLICEIEPGVLYFWNQNIEKVRSRAIAYAPDIQTFAVLGEEAKGIVSTDGVNWTPKTPPNYTFRSICWSPALSLFVAVASSGSNLVVTSPDGGTWTPQSAAEASGWRSVCWSPELSLFVAVAATGTNRVMTSPNGTTWTARSAAEANGWISVCWSPELSLFVAVSTTGTNRVMTSPDGTNWTARSAAEANGWLSVCWSPELSLFVAVSNTGTNRVMTSPDGTNWTARSAAEANSWQSVCWSPELSLFVAVSLDGTNRVMTSPDGTNWTARSAAEANSWISICWSPELSLFVAVSLDGTNRVMTSENGTTWTVDLIAYPDFQLDYLDGIDPIIEQSEGAVRWLQKYEDGSTTYTGDSSLPIWNLGFLEGTPPSVQTDPFYKFAIKLAPIRLDITDGDRINFSPSWQLDPSRTIDAPVIVTEHFDPKKSPSLWQEIKSLDLFSSRENTPSTGAPSTIERISAYTPLSSIGFDGNLTPEVNNLQALAEAVDDLPLGESAPATTAANDFQVGDGSGNWIKKTLAQTITILRTSLNSIYAAVNEWHSDILAISLKNPPADADSFGINDVAGGNVKKRVSFTVARSYMRTLFDTLYTLVDTTIPIDGWAPISTTWTRTGNHTFTVSGDVTATYRKGAKVRYKDGGAYEYGVIASSSYSSPNTTITLITNSDYAMAAATITDKYISYIENPEGFPDWFNWTPTFTGFSADPSGGIYRWRAYGQTVKCFIRQPNTGTSNATGFTISAPVTAATITNMQWGVLASVTDNGTFLTTPGAMRILTAGTVFDVFKDSSLAAFTASGTKRVFSANIEYQF